MSTELESKLHEKIESLGYCVSGYVYAPGTIFSDHTHNVDKIDAVISGVFKITLEGKEITLHADEMIHIPKGALHSAEVMGDEPVISLNGIKTG